MPSESKSFFQELLEHGVTLSWWIMLEGSHEQGKRDYGEGLDGR